MTTVNIDTQRIDIYEFEQLMNIIHYINLMPLQDLQLYENGKLITIPPEKIDEFRFTGLNNVDFIKSRYWEEDK